MRLTSACLGLGHRRPAACTSPGQIELLLREAVEQLRGAEQRNLFRFSALLRDDEREVTD